MIKDMARTPGIAQDLIGYMHIYKCGGTSFNWALQKAFPGRVLYCEDSSSLNRRIEREQFFSFRESSSKLYSALSSHLISYEALEHFTYVVTTIRDPAKRLLSAYNFDIARGDCAISLDEYIEQRRDVMSWTLGDGFIKDIDSGRIFCCILEDYDLSISILEYYISTTAGYYFDLAIPKSLNIGSEKIKDKAKAIQLLNPDQVRRIRKLNQNDYDLYLSQRSKLIGMSMAIPSLEDKLRDYELRKKLALERLKEIHSYGQGPRHFVFI